MGGVSAPMKPTPSYPLLISSILKGVTILLAIRFAHLNDSSPGNVLVIASCPTPCEQVAPSFFTLNQKYDYPQWPAVIYVKSCFAALPLVSLIMRTEKNTVEDARFIYTIAASFVLAAEWL